MEGNTPVISGNDRRSITNSSNNSSGSISSNSRSISNGTEELESVAAKQRQRNQRHSSVPDQQHATKFRFDSFNIISSNSSEQRQ
mmetsp:Transcript_14944/g.33726  ORF Transcript_14944/g.33726 Transcript_14944/m.33726 type:complete len:85 (+) Transcript_14944:233-487(+)